MSSLQRSRSLRKPTTATTSSRLAATDSAPRQDDAEPRHASPSRLPIKPLTRSATVASSSSSSSTRTLRSGSTTSASGPVTRSNGLSRSASVRQTTSSSSSSSAQEPARSSRYPPSTTTTRPRPAAAARPTSSDGPPAPTRRVTAHTRAKSTTMTTLRNAPVLRPPSGGSTSSASSTTTRTTTVVRKVSGGRPEKPTAASSISSSSSTAAATAQPRLRPAFTTLQQHYSPAKSTAPKPLTSTFLAPPSPSKRPANVAASAETSKLQTELLQLHLLHRDAAAVDAEWRASAKSKLGERFAHVAAEGRRIDDLEKAEIERENVLTLRSWSLGGGLEERIQTLDAVINGVWTLGEPGGRYARVVRRFERWVDRMCEIEDARRGDGATLQEQDVLFIGELDAAWKDECEGLIRRLDGIKRQLQELGQVPEEEREEGQTSLRRMVDNSTTLVDSMLAELNLMGEIEREALAREEDWIERMNRDDDTEDTPSAGAIWRVVV